MGFHDDADAHLSDYDECIKSLSTTKIDANYINNDGNISVNVTMLFFQ